MTAQVFTCAVTLLMFGCKEEPMRLREKIDIEIQLQLKEQKNQNLSAVIAKNNNLIRFYRGKNCLNCDRANSILDPRTYLSIDYRIIKRDEKFEVIQNIFDNFIYKTSLKQDESIYVAFSKQNLKNVDGLCAWNFKFNQFKIVPKKIELICKEQEKPPILNGITITY